jgi:D-3-phosphoglycerate dehydrogenase
MKILALDGIAPEGITYLEKQGFTVDQKPSQTEAELIEVIPSYNGLLVRSGTRVTAKALAAAGKLQVIGRAGVGVDNIDLEEASRRGIQVVNSPNGNTVAAAEHTMALLLSLARNVPRAHAQLKQGRWERKTFTGVELAGKVLGVLGLGKVGTAVARRAQAFEMKVIGYDPYLPRERVRKLGVEIASLEDVLCQADFLTLHLPLTPETRHMIGREQLALVKPTAMLVNVARGGIIAEDALYHALAAGQVAGAALDVFEEEPARENPLFSLDNVIVTPHLGASTREAQIRVAVEVAEDIAGILRGEPPVNPVNRPVQKPWGLKKVAF